LARLGERFVKKKKNRSPHDQNIIKAFIALGGGREEEGESRLGSENRDPTATRSIQKKNAMKRE